MKRFIFLLSLATLLPASIQAQNRVADYIAALQSPSGSGGRITVTSDSDVSAGLRTAPTGDRVNGYRVTIFSDNSQNGRSRANGALAAFRSAFPGIPAEVVYINPTFKVNAGYCLNQTEATMLLGRARSLFPAAILFHETFPVGGLISHPQEEETISEQAESEEA